MSYKKLILASASQRRRELMESMGLEFTVDCSTSFKEIVPESTAPEDIPSLFAEGKSKGFHRPLADDEVLITADTVVVCDGILMGKPADKDDARSMLRLLSGRTHKVVSAICVRDSKCCITHSDTALVTFREMSDEEIDFYVEKFKPLDKAGAYGIQEWIGLVAATSINGSFYTIMGLPTHLLSQMLSDINYR